MKNPDDLKKIGRVEVETQSLRQQRRKVLVGTTKHAGTLSAVAISLMAFVAVEVSVPRSVAADSEPFWQSLFKGGGGGRPQPRHVDDFSKSYAPGMIIVSFGDRRLYHVRQRGKAISYPIGVPVADETWVGTERVSAKRMNSSWTPTREMRRENPDLPPFVRGGDPRNPLGVRALYLGSTLYRIHGTDAPWTIGQVVSSGCIRMFNDDVVELYSRVPVGTKVIVTSRRFVPHHG